MPIALILQYALQYGLPAALEIIKLFQKSSVNLADWEAAFAVAQTPYGLTAQLTDPVTDLGLIAAASQQPAPDPPGGVRSEMVIVSVKPFVSGGANWRTICNVAGNCWAVDITAMTRTDSGEGQIWTAPSGVKFFLTKEALAQV